MPRMLSSKTFPVISLITVASLAGAQSIQAQSDQATGQQAQHLPTLTVTARHVEEKVQDLPISVNIIDSEQVEYQRLNSLEEAMRQIPGVDVQSYGDTSNAAIRIRGVGALNKASRDDSSVVLYVDGMPQPVGNLTLGTLDLERIEVLKGPQGTLFGRNSEAGVVQLVTRKPGFEPEAEFKAEYGQERQRLLEAAGTVPISEELTSRIALRYQGAEHPVTNANDGKTLSKPNTLQARGNLRWFADDWTEVNLSMTHQRMRDHAAAMILRPYGSKPVTGVSPGVIRDDKDITQLVLNIQRELSFAEFTSITGGLHSEDRVKTPMYEPFLYQKLIGMSPPEAARTIDTEEKVFNQELRLTALPESRVFWATGLHLYKSDRSLDTGELNDTFYPSNPFNAEIKRQYDTKSLAVYGETTWPLTSRLSLTSGLRHTWDQKRYQDYWKADNAHPDAGLVRQDQQKLNDNYTTGRLAASYAIDPSLNIYTSYAQGYKSGGWADHGSNIASGLREDPYKAARVGAWEVGIKGEALQGRLMVNAALFLTNTEKDHLYTWNPTTFAVGIENLDTRSRGAELSVNWQVNDSLRLNGALTYTDAVISSVPHGSTSGVLKGYRVPEVARWSSFVSLDHHRPLNDVLGLADMSLNSYLSWRYVGARQNGPENHFELPSYQLVDARVGVTHKNAELYLWGNNLLDDQYDLYGFYYPAMMPGGSSATLGAPARGRALGVGLRYAF